MAVTFKQANSAEGSGTSLAVAFSSAVTAGSLLVSACASNATQTVPTDTLAQTYTGADPLAGAATSQLELYYVANSAAGSDTVTEHTTGAAALGEAIAEFGGVATTAPLDGAIHGTATGTGSSAAITLTGVNTGDVVVAAVTTDSGTMTAISVSAGFTIPAGGSQTSTVNLPIALAYNVVSATGNVTCTFTLTGAAGTDNWTVVAAAFKPSGGAAPTELSHLLVLGVS